MLIFPYLDRGLYKVSSQPFYSELLFSDFYSKDPSAMMDMQIRSILAKKDFVTLRNALMRLTEQGTVDSEIIKHQAVRLVKHYIEMGDLAEVATLNEYFGLSEEKGDNAGSYAQLYAEQGLSGEITRLENILVKNELYSQLKPLYLSAFRKGYISR